MTPNVDERTGETFKTARVFKDVYNGINESKMKKCQVPHKKKKKNSEVQGEINVLVCLYVIHLIVHQFQRALKVFILRVHCTFITFMIPEQVLLSSVVDIIVLIFQKRKLNRIRKKKFNARQPLKIKRKKKADVTKKTSPTYRPSSKIRVKLETRLIFIRPYLFEPYF